MFPALFAWREWQVKDDSSSQDEVLRRLDPYSDSWFSWGELLAEYEEEYGEEDFEEEEEDPREKERKRASEREERGKVF